MTVSRFYKALEKINIDAVRQIGVQAVHENEDVIVSDSIVANIEGLTFLGNQIKANPPFTDWEETGQFHETLKFRDKSNIEFTAKGDGAEAVFVSFDYEDTIAPSVKTLSDEAINNITKSFVEILKDKLT